MLLKLDCSLNDLADSDDQLTAKDNGDTVYISVNESISVCLDKDAALVLACFLLTWAKGQK